MDVKKVLIIAGIVVAVMLAAGGIWYFTVMNGGEKKESDENRIQIVDASDVSSNASEDTGKVSASNIEGIENTTLTLAEIRKMEEYLTEKMYSGVNLDEEKFVIEEKGVDSKGRKIFKVTRKRDGEVSTIKVSDSEAWFLVKGYSDATSGLTAQSSSSAASASSTSANTSSSSSNNTPSTNNSSNTTSSNNTSTPSSTLNSAKAGASFDQGRAFKLSDTSRARDVLGKDVADSLLKDLNSYLSTTSVKDNKAENVLVDPDSVSDSDDTRTFTIMVKSNNDRIVFTCKYDLATNRSVFEWQE